MRNISIQERLQVIVFISKITKISVFAVCQQTIHKQIIIGCVRINQHPTKTRHMTNRSLYCPVTVITLESLSAFIMLGISTDYFCLKLTLRYKRVMLERKKFRNININLSLFDRLLGSCYLIEFLCTPFKIKSK